MQGRRRPAQPPFGRTAGGAGNDTLAVDGAADRISELAGEGIDLVIASVSWTLGANFENLSLLGNVVADGTGNELANVLRGSGGANIQRGEAGNDSLYGNAGDDVLAGGAGADAMWGGAGADRFVFAFGDSGRAPGARDSIGDFDAADLIDLSAIDADPRTLAHEALRIGQEVTWRTAGSHVLVEARLADAAQADFAILVTPVLGVALGAADFVLG